jgi:peroxiredoxin family protein
MPRPQPPRSRVAKVRMIRKMERCQRDGKGQRERLQVVGNNVV